MRTVPRFQRGAIATFMLGLALVTAGNAGAYTVGNDSVLNKNVSATLEQCRNVSTSCASMTQDAMAVLVFPSVIKADLIIGGAGGKGALVEHGKVTGYYSIGAVSAGLQAGIENLSHVYVFRTAESLSKLKSGPDLKLGASAGVTLIDADANAAGNTSNVLAYVFDAKGLHAGISLDVFDVWKTGQPRPSNA